MNITRRPAWPKILAPYRQPNRVRSTVELVITIAPLILLWALTWVAVEYDQWWGLVLILPAAGFWCACS